MSDSTGTATLVALLMGIAGVSAAAAQDEAGTDSPAVDSGSGRLENIVVTATRRATNLQDTPLAITALTSNDLEQRGVADVADLGALVPNGSFRQGQGAYGKVVTAFIRGIGQYDGNLASEPAVAFYLDDVYYPLLFGSQFDLLDLDHVEVLRGPQGTLFGRNALAGAINIVSRQPDFDESSGFVNVTTGRYARLDVRAGFNLPMADNLALRVNASSKKREGYQKRLDFRCEMVRRGTPELAADFPYLEGHNIPSAGYTPGNCEVGTLGGTDSHALRAAIRWQPVDALDITLVGDYTDDQSENQADYVLDIDDTVGTSRANINAIGDYYTSEGQDPLRYDSRFVTGNPYTTYATNADPIPAGVDLPGSTFYNGSPLRGGLAYPLTSPLKNYGFSLKGVYSFDSDMQLTTIVGYRVVDNDFGFDVDGSPFALEQTRNNTGSKHWTGELRFTGTREHYDWTGGLFFYSGEGYVHTTLTSPWNNLQRYQNHDYDPDSQAAYLNVVLKPSDRLRLNLGGRYSDEEKSVRYDNRQDENPAGDIVFDLVLEDQRFDWKAGVDFDLAPGTLIYASAATGFSLPTFNSRPFQPSQVGQITGSETLAYELGLKTDLFDDRLRLNAATFFTDFKTRPTSIAGQEYLLDANGQPIPVDGGGSVTEPLPDGGAGATTCRVLTQQEIDAGTQGYQCVSRSYYINTPGEVYGFELEFQSEPIDRLRFDGSMGYAKFSSADVDATLNQRVARIPEWTANAGVQYEFLVPALDGSVTPRLDWFYEGSIVYETNNARYNQSAYSVFNARLTYHMDKHDADIAFGATNLFDTFYYQNLFVLQGFGFPQANGQPSRPREWFLSINKQF